MSFTVSAVLVLGLLHVSTVVCIRVTKEYSDTTSTLTAGSVIDGRYVLVKQLKNVPFGHGGPITNGNMSSPVQQTALLQKTKGVPAEVRRYSIKTPRLLGRGAAAEAWLAYRYNTARGATEKVVVKISTAMSASDLTKECRMMQRLQESARFLSATDEDKAGAARLLKCLECHTSSTSADDDEAPYIVIEYGGEPRANNIAMVKFARPIVKQLLEGIAYMAKQGFVHRDLKGDNYLLKTEEGNPISMWTNPDKIVVTIIDFGLSGYGYLCQSRTTNGNEECPDTLLAECEPWSKGEFPQAPPEARGEQIMSLCDTYKGKGVIPEYWDIWSLAVIALYFLAPPGTADMLLREANVDSMFQTDFAKTWQGLLQSPALRAAMGLSGVKRETLDPIKELLHSALTADPVIRSRNRAINLLALFDKA